MAPNRTIIAALSTLSFLIPAASPTFAQELPLGDGRVTTYPASGNVFACNQNFRTGGARHVGEWFKGDTWNPLEKPHVQGNVFWPDAQFKIRSDGDRLAVTGNGLPVGSATGSFPISRSDPAYAYDKNPNPISAIAMRFTIPSQPAMAQSPGCLSMGMIGFTLNGVAFYNALDDAGNDAAAHEVQDLCDGHPQGKGQYHYHSSSSCLPGADRNVHVGWALDGYPILGMVDATGRTLGNADLDACHGRPERVSIDGRSYDYAYRLTPEYPYTLGCFTGKVQRETTQAIRAAMGPPRRQGTQSNPGPRPGAEFR